MRCSTRSRWWRTDEFALTAQACKTKITLAEQGPIDCVRKKNVRNRLERTNQVSIYQ